GSDCPKGRLAEEKPIGPRSEHSIRHARIRYNHRGGQDDNLSHFALFNVEEVKSNCMSWSKTERPMQTIDLADGGMLVYDPNFLSPDVADHYFIELRDHSAWEQKPGVFGHMQPRLTASYGDEGVIYRYSGTENVALSWTT